MGKLEKFNNREELLAERRRLDELIKFRDRRDEVHSGEDRKISGKIQIPPELKNASLEELIEFVKKSS